MACLADDFDVTPVFRSPSGLRTLISGNLFEDADDANDVVHFAGPAASLIAVDFSSFPPPAFFHAGALSTVAPASTLHRNRWRTAGRAPPQNS